MINTILAFVVVFLLLMWVCWELGWGGGTEKNR